MGKINRNQPPIEENPRKLRILVAPLDWGLGHATRCIPVIYELLKNGAVPIIAADGPQAELLRQEFPTLSIISLPGYRVKYSQSGAGFFRMMLLQVPRLLRAIRQEHNWLVKLLAKEHIHGIISDNRYGLHQAAVPSVFLTHQLAIKTGKGKWSDRLIQRKNYRYIDRFTECWIPDEPGEVNYAGELSHPVNLPGTPIRYVSALSRLKSTGTTPVKNHLFIALSGPEPQRTRLEDIIIEQVSHYDGTATIVRGLPESHTLIPSTNDIRFYNHLNKDDFALEMERAELVISRSGYSTVMDLLQMGKKSILIPTPGQTEQEYLGHYLQSRSMALTINQSSFSLTHALSLARDFHYVLPPPTPNTRLEEAVQSFLLKCGATL